MRMLRRAKVDLNQVGKQNAQANERRGPAKTMANIMHSTVYRALRSLYVSLALLLRTARMKKTVHATRAITYIMPGIV